MRASKPKSLYALKINQFSCDPEVSLFFGGIFAAILNSSFTEEVICFSHAETLGRTPVGFLSLPGTRVLSSLTLKPEEAFHEVGNPFIQRGSFWLRSDDVH